MAKGKIIVVGGGIGGLTAGALLAQDGYRVTVLEASREWGGCAGKFERGDYLFASGATLGMGLEEGGIHERIFRHLGLKAEAVKLDEVMKIRNGERTLTFHADRTKHVNELQKQFPDYAIQIQSFYQDIYDIAARIRLLMKKLPALPLRSIRETIELAGALKPEHVKLTPGFLKTVYSLLRKHSLHSCKGFISFIDGQLIDSMQTTSKDCALLMGALALDIYHEGAYYVKGGLYQFAHLLVKAAQKNGAEMILGRRVLNIKKQNGKLEVTDHRGKVRIADHVICNTPVQSLPSILEDEIYNQLSLPVKRKSGEKTWGTMTLYLSLKDDQIPENFPLFQQLSEPGSVSHDEGSHLFLSISEKGDTLRAPDGSRTMTVSTHIDLSQWETKEQYDRNKELYTDKMMSLIQYYYPWIREALIELYPGAPRAWERFTFRPSGMVGGFPQTRTHSLFLSLSHRTPVKNLWLCGDSIFPGGGTIGVSVSGYHCFHSISGRKLIQ
ncbi:FAD-dependent oxidoreductase [Jeotgalibacillus aurantiacus]|uniref:FAD-dependent oxidoreductase n=1 Tax=Jeotgalibacillus aurantiacus TaxID=2763266 RepID=UPI001D0B30E2|nr:FAD-dependent oxidoreductase [Jeotgalibacillus aurantiacus]